MRIIIKDTLNNQTVLCDGPERGLNRNMGPIGGGIPTSDEVVIQPVGALRATMVKHFNRKNQSTSMSLQVVREMASVQAAMLWQLQALRDTIRLGTIEFTEHDASGNSVTVTLRNAAIQRIAFVPLGVSREITYTIVGGMLT